MPRSQRRKPLQARSRDTIAVIVRATAQILAREGPDRLTTNEVAAVAGVSVGSLYQYFANKEELVAAVRARYQEAFRDRLVAALGRVAGLPLAAAAAELVRVLIELHAEDPRLHNALGSGMPDAERRLFEQVAATYLAAHRGVVRRPDLALAATVALEAAESLIHGAALHAPERLADPAFAREVTDLLVRYLVRDEPERPRGRPASRSRRAATPAS